MTDRDIKRRSILGIGLYDNDNCTVSSLQVGEQPKTLV